MRHESSENDFIVKEQEKDGLASKGEEGSMDPMYNPIRKKL